MTEERQIRRADMIFRIVILALAALWVVYPPGRAPDAPRVTALSDATR